MSSFIYLKTLKKLLEKNKLKIKYCPISQHRQSDKGK